MEMATKMKRKIVRSTNAQIKILVDHMVSNPFFAAGEYTGPLGSKKLEEEWAALSSLLGNHGPQKTVEQWKHTWRDLKKKAREEGAAVRKAHTATGNNVPVPTLSEQSEKILSTIGHACSTGIASAGGETGVGPGMELPEVAEIVEVQLEETPHTSDTDVASTSNNNQPAQQHKKRRVQESYPSRFVQAQEKTNTLLQELRQTIAENNATQAGILLALQKIADNLNRSGEPQKQN